MASDAVRLLEIQLEAHKRCLHEKAQRIDELEARNIDLEAQVDHLEEVVAKQRAQLTDRIGPLADVNSKRKSDRGPEPETGNMSAKRRRLTPQEAVQPRSSNSNHRASHPDGRRATVDAHNPNGAKDGASQPPVRQRQPHQSPNTIPQPPQSAQVPSLPRRETLGSGSRAHYRADPSTEPLPVEDPGSESDPSYEPEDEDDGHAQTRRGRGPSPNPSIAARLASIEPFAHGVVAEELLSSTAERKAIGRRLGCKGKKTVVYRQDGTAFLFPTRKLHPYAPAEQGVGGLFFSALLSDDCELSGTFQVFVCITPGKWKYMGKYALQRTSPLDRGEFESLPRGTKSNWGRDLLEQKRYGSIRKAIHRRMIHGRTVDKQDIIAAYEQGEEKMFVWKMKCVGFDYDILCQATGLQSEEEHYQ